jgi:creatinine amidohydrolase
LPYATDTIQCESVAARAAEIAWRSGTRAIVLPAVPFGVNTGQLDIPLCLNMNPSTQLAVLKDLVDVIQRAGVRKLVICNGHGGNDFKSMIRELSQAFPKVFVCAANWYKAVDPAAYFDEPGDHAGELETSVVQHLRPECVRPLAEAGDGHSKNYRIAALREGWVVAQRAWTQVTADTGVGNPRAATPEKGRRYFEASAEKLAAFFVDLAGTPLDDFYE